MRRLFLWLMCRERGPKRGAMAVMGHQGRSKRNPSRQLQHPAFLKTTPPVDPAEAGAYVACRLKLAFRAKPTSVMGPSLR